MDQAARGGASLTDRRDLSLVGYTYLLSGVDSTWNRSNLTFQDLGPRTRTVALLPQTLRTDRPVHRPRKGENVRKKALLLGTLLIALAGCSGGGGGGGSDTSDATAEGIWIGDFTSDAGDTYPTVAVVKGGELTAFAFQDDLAYAGNINVDGDGWSASVDGYDMDTQSRFATGQLEGSITTQDSMSGSYSASTGETGSISLDFQDFYNRTAEVSKMTGTWTSNINGVNHSLTFDANQEVTGQSGDGCTYNGSYTIPDPDHNLYRATVTESCPDYTSDLSGYAWLEDSDQGTNDTLVIGVHDGSAYSLSVFY